MCSTCKGGGKSTKTTMKSKKTMSMPKGGKMTFGVKKTTKKRY